MNKYALFGLLILWLLVATYLIAIFNSYDPTTGVTVVGGINAVAPGDGGFLSQIGNLLLVFWSIFSLQISGFPVIVIIILFDVPVFIVVYMFIDIIKDLIPFT